MSVPRYLLDENVNPVLRGALVQRRPDMTVWRIGDPCAPPSGTLDPEILIWCEEHNFVLLTNNRSSMPVHLAAHLAAGRHVPGIFILDPGMSIGETVDELELIWGASEAHEYADQLRHLPVSE